MLSQRGSIILLVLGALLLLGVVGIGAYFSLSEANKAANKAANTSADSPSETPQPTPSPAVIRQPSVSTVSAQLIKKEYTQSSLNQCIKAKNAEYVDYKKGDLIEGELIIAPKRYKGERDISFLISLIEENSLTYREEDTMLKVFVPIGDETEWLCRLSLQQEAGIVSRNVRVPGALIN